MKPKKMNEQYTVGICPKCGENSPLKYGLCPKCQGKDDDAVVDNLMNMFGMGNEKGNKK